MAEKTLYSLDGASSDTITSQIPFRNRKALLGSRFRDKSRLTKFGPQKLSELDVLCVISLATPHLESGQKVETSQRLVIGNL
jgi:hypothetical protein